MNQRILTILSMLCLIGPGHLMAQITVDETLTAVDVVTNILLGEGVEVSNITFSGDLDQIGSFANNNSNILIEEGLIMATGSCSNVIGPNNSGSSTTGGGNFGVGDDDLTALSTFSTNDAAVLEFDFIPSGDSIKFFYSFGSDEYNEYVCGSVNDAFGFFLSGPGINGPFANNAVNLAIIPDTDIPVTINSVNNGTVGGSGTAANCAQVSPDWMNNTEFYIDNANNADPNATQLDGFTVKLTAEAQVQCGQTYHLKIAIADAGDTAFDSAVFIEGGSFGSNSVDLVASASISGNAVFLGDTTVVESCNQALLTVLRPQTDLEEDIELTIYGTAENGVDYEYIDPVITMVGGQTQFDIPVIVIDDGIDEGPESIIVDYMYINLCGDSVLRTATLVIMDPEPIVLEYDSPVGICNGQALLEVDPVAGFGPFTFIWDTSPVDTLATNVITTESAGAATVVVADVCGNEVEATIGYALPPPLDVDVDQENNPLCPGDDVTMSSVIVTGVGPYSYIWFDGDYLSSPTPTGGTDDTEVYDYTSTGEISLEVTDGCGQTSYANWNIVVPNYPALMSEFTDVCTGVETAANIEGGTGSYTFQTYQYFDVDPFTGVPGDSALVSLDAELDSLVTFLSPFGVFSAGFGNGWQWVLATDQCGTQTDFYIEVVACDTEIPNVFSPNNDQHNNTFYIKGIEGFPRSSIAIYNRWGNLIYENGNYKGGWDGRMGTEPVAEGTYFYVFNRSDGVTFHGSVTLVR
jgi:gliding motility-associated-like protein